MKKAINARFLSILAITAMTSVGAISGEISGKALECSGFGISGVTIVVENQEGAQIVVRTDAAGRYQVKNLNPGYYFWFPEEPPGYQLAKPPCGSYYEYVGPDDNVKGDFHFTRGVGVVLDFGSPGTGFTGLIMSGSSFSMSLFASGLALTGPAYPDAILVQGYWQVIGAGTLYVNSATATGAGPYSGAAITSQFNNLGGGYISLLIMNNTAPGFNMDGEVATFTFNLDAYSQNLLNQSGGSATFCMTSVTFLHNNEVVEEKSEQFIGNID